MKVLYIASLLHLVQFQITFMRKSTQQMMFLIELYTLKSVKLYALPLKKRDQRKKKTRHWCRARPNFLRTYWKKRENIAESHPRIGTEIYHFDINF